MVEEEEMRGMFPPEIRGKTRETLAPTVFVEAIMDEYPHDDPRGVVDGVYLPEELVGRRYFEPTNHGAEGELVEALERRRRGEPEHDGGTQAASETKENGAR